jgi:AbrB family looped-hinge helix DNA binding protein
MIRDRGKERFMAAATITSKGQITIPVQVRTELGLETGDRVEFVRNEKTGRYEVIPATVSIQSLKGILPRRKKPLTIREMNEAIRRRGASAR